MFTHLPSRTVYVDADLCGGEGWLGYWVAHELGHLATNSTKEEDAEKAAREFRRRLKDARRGNPHSYFRVNSSSEVGPRKALQQPELGNVDAALVDEAWVPKEL